MNIYDHFLLQNKGKGCNKLLRGKVAFVHVLVADSVSDWTDESAVKRHEAILKNGSNWLMQQAAKAGVTLNIRNFILMAKVNKNVEMKTGDMWHYEALESVGRHSIDNIQSDFKKRGFDEAVIIFSFNKNERSFAHPANSTQPEYAVTFADGSNMTIPHEVIHLYGAPDYYYDDVIQKAERTHLGKSIMGESGEDLIVDDLSQYFLGWRDDLSAKAVSFLQAVAHYNWTSWYAGLQKKNITGKGTIKCSTGVYTGDLVNGVMHGWGVYKFTNGSTYTGEFRHGILEGKATYRYAGGAVFEGTYKNGHISGQGTLRYANGDVYTGEFDNDTFNGYGEYKPFIGFKKKGIWKDGSLIKKMH